MGDGRGVVLDLPTLISDIRPFGCQDVRSTDEQWPHGERSGDCRIPAPEVSMDECPHEIDQALTELEAKPDTLTETDISSAINGACKQIEEAGRELTPEARAEAIAFSFHERRGESNNAWGTYYGPMMTWQSEDGTTTESPSIKSVTSEVLEYWTCRADAVMHPLLRARYSGLVWEFSPKVVGHKAPVRLAYSYIDAVIDMADGVAHRYATEVFSKLGHALGIALSLNDAGRVERVRDAILQLENAVAEDDKPGLWGYGFDLLVKNKKVSLDNGVRDKIIADLEGRLERLSDPSFASTLNPWAAEAAAQRLARHFRRSGSPEDVRRVLLKVGRAFGHLAEKADPMVAQAWLQQVHALYSHYGLTDAAADLRKSLRELGPRARDRLVRHTHEVEIPKDEMDAFVEAMVEGGVAAAIERFIVHYIPRRQETEEQLRQLSTEHALVFIMPSQIVDDRGRPVASVGSLQSDLDGHVIRQTAQNIGFVAVFMRRAIEETLRRYAIDIDTVMSWIAQSPVFATEKHDLVRRGLLAYLDDDSVGALHLLIPQVEDAVRELLALTGGDVYRPNRLGGMDLRPFDDLLRDEALARGLGTDVTEYFRILYTDRRGLNLRNRLSHGMLSADSIHIGLADRVFHTVVMLAHLRAKNSRGEAEAV